MYVKVTDGAVTRFFNLNDRRSHAIYKELVENRTGYKPVIESTGAVKEFTEEQVKSTIDKAQTAANKKPRKTTVATGDGVLDEE